MSQLTIYADTGAAASTRLTDHVAIAGALATIGVRFERWQASQPLGDTPTQDEVIAAYRQPIDRLMTEGDYRSVDVVAMRPDHPERVALRQKFLAEHTHSEDELRFFVKGRGLFVLHREGKVHAVLCEQGDLIAVPAGTPHWFDMGEAPSFVAIRIFGTLDGWVARFTGSDIADRYPRLDG